MAYVLELSNSKTNQNDGGVDDDDDEDDNRSNNDSDNIRSNHKYVNVSSRDNRNFYNNHNQNGDGGGGGDADKINNALNRGPFFDVSASKNVTALVGKTANLNCRIKNLQNKTVSKHTVYLLIFTIFTIQNDNNVSPSYLNLLRTIYGYIIIQV